MSVEIDVQLIDTKILLNELLSRFDHAGFIGLMIPVDTTTQHEGPQAITRRWVGNSHCIAGLAADLKLCVLSEYLDKEIPPEEKE